MRGRLVHAFRDPAWAVRAVGRRARTSWRDVFAAPAERCLVCGSSRNRVFNVEVPRGRFAVRVCQRCSYVSNPGNAVDYTAFKSVSKFSLTPRVGTAERPGREYHMAVMATEILGRDKLNVMVFGAGRSLDYQHIAGLQAVRRVVMADVVDWRGEAEFVDITKGTAERFDVIIACEVVEHFTDPRPEFARLLRLLTAEGLLVCSTNIYDRGHPSKHSYLFAPGHTSYYSPAAIATIADQNKMLFDFRMPQYGEPFAVFGRRKRYVLFTRSTDNLLLVARYFGTHPYAPAEQLPQTSAKPDSPA